MEEWEEGIIQKNEIVHGLGHPRNLEVGHMVRGVPKISLMGKY